MKEHSKLFEALSPGVLLIPAFVKIPTKNPKSPILGLPAALLLSQAWYMARHKREGWEYSPHDWADKTGLSNDQITRGLQLLCKLGILERWQRSCVRVLTYRVNFATLEKLLLSCTTITAPARLCTTAPARLCTTAPARLSLMEHRSFVSQKRGDNAREQRGANAPLTPPPSLDQWREFAGTISPTWAKSLDCKKVFYDLQAVEWKTGKYKTPVKNWQAKAKALCEIWRREHGGQAEERANLGTVKASLKPTPASYAAPKPAKGSIGTQTKAEKSAAKALLEGLQASTQRRTR